MIDEAGTIRANVISSQGVHDRYGGVVPEVAARHHLELVDVAVEDALRQAQIGLDDVSLVGVTQGPGLVGALLIGLSEAKAIAAARELPLAAVDHLQGHVAANFLGPEPFEPPFVCLIASGGHTLLAHVTDHHGFTVLGSTLDDAAGEAFDKGARMLGLGYPGGPALQRLAAGGDASAHRFPTADNVTGLDFSFAGVKTALLYALREEDRPSRRRPGRRLPARDRRAARAAHRAGAGPDRVGTAGHRRRCRRQRPAARAPRRAEGGHRAHPAPRAVHRQRGDDRQRRPLRRPAGARRLPGPGRLRQRRAAPVSVPVVHLYGRPGCHLCDDARAVVQRAARRVSLELVEVDIESDDRIFAAMLERIPVICVDGTEHSELFVDEDALVAALSSAHT